MASLRVSVSVLCLLLLSGSSEAAMGDNRAGMASNRAGMASNRAGMASNRAGMDALQAKAEAVAMLANHLEVSFTAANVSLTNLVNTRKTLTHFHSQNFLRKALGAFDGVARVVPFIDAFGSSARFALAVTSNGSPDVTHARRRLEEIGGQLDALSAQAKPLPTRELWPSEQEAAILNAWTRLKQLVRRLALAETREERTRAAQRFAADYESGGAEDAIAGFHRRLTERGGGGGGGLLRLIGEMSEGDVKVLTTYSSYVTALTLRGAVVSVTYEKLKSDREDPQTSAAAERLVSLTKLIQRTLMDCADGYAVWVRNDVARIMAHPFTEVRSMATGIKAHLDGKFSWFTWTVIVQDSSAEYGPLYGNSVTVRSQGQTVHLVARDSEAAVNEGVRVEARQKMQQNPACPVIQEHMTKVFPTGLLEHIAFAHSSQESADYTAVGDAVMETCYSTFLFITTNTYINTVVLKSMESTDNPSCSKVQCLHGDCREIKGSSSGLCLCETMFYGHRCENSIMDEISNSALEEKLNSVKVNPVPDLTALYFLLQELVRLQRAEAEEEFRWVKLRYQDVLDKLSFLGHQGTLFKRRQISVERFVSNVEGVVQAKGAFAYLLYRFDNMMRGGGLDEDSSLLEALRKLLLHPGDATLQPHDPVECSKTYTGKLDTFVRSMSALKSEAVTAWRTYLLQLGVTSADPSLDDAEGLVVGNGCGPLSADDLINDHCKELYHSADQQHVPLRCSGSFKPFPETVQCSKGQWSALPVCYSEPSNGATRCRLENGTTACEASCDDGYALAPGAASFEAYQCSRPPCRAYAPAGPCKVSSCSSSAVCDDSEVCEGGRCVDGCSSSPCGANAVCSATVNHVPVCTCVGPWTKNLKQECRSPKLQWAQVTHIPNGTVKTYTGKLVCRAKGPDGTWYSGWRSTVLGRDSCLLEYGGKTMRAAEYELLLDPCERKGYMWMPGGPFSDSVWTDYTNSTPGSMLFVCSWWGDFDSGKRGFSGTLVQTTEGYRCSIALNRAAHTTADYLTLIETESCYPEDRMGW